MKGRRVKMSILEEVAHLLERTTTSDAFGAFLVAVIFGLSVVALYLIGTLIFEKIDEDQGTKESGTGKVVELIYTHEYSTATLVASIPVPHYSPESWKLTLMIDGKLATICVTEAMHNQTHLGDMLQANYIRGRFTGKIYLTEVY